jgi:predicted PurR-regulated permease PerM
MNNRVKFDISTTTIIKIALVILGIWFIFAIKDIVVLFFIVLVIVAALTPMVDKMSKYIPRIVALLIITIIFLSALTAIGFLLIPPIVNQIEQLATNLPYILDNLNPTFNNLQIVIKQYQSSLLNLSSELGGFSAGLYSTTVGFFTGIVAIITILVLSFYLLLEQNSLRNFMRNLIPEEQEETVFNIIHKISTKMGNWLRGQGVLMIVIGILDWVALAAVGVPYALTLAVWGGLTEIIPYIGPWMGLVPALIVAYTVSPVTALIVIIAYVLIQQLEGHLLVPKMMGKAVGLSPVIIILALLIGAKLMGVLGVLISVPAAAAISVIVQEWPEIKKLRTQ